MAIKHFNDRRLPYRVYWRCPFTGKTRSKHVETLSEARKLDSLVKHQIIHDPEALRPEEAPITQTELTVSAVVWLYLKARTMKPENLKTTLYHVRPVLELVGQVPVTDLRISTMREAVATMSDVCQTTINRRVSIIKAALNWAEAQELIEANPVRMFSAPRGQNTQIPPPSKAELEAMLVVAEPHVQRVIVLGLFFGVRVGPSEMFKITWEHVDLLAWSLRVWSADKNQRRQYRDLRIRESLRPLFLAWRNADADIDAGYLIHYQGKPVGTIKRAWKETLRRAGITRRIRPYDLRHAHATEALAAGADIKAVAENMGHADTSMIYKHYQHVLVKQREEALFSVPDLVIQNGNTKGPV
ncbi:MAG: site-specific integrase [Desulfomicrobium sp.]|nr:site-specific integrase [Desulfomicrobium sp.]